MGSDSRLTPRGMVRSMLRLRPTAEPRFKRLRNLLDDLHSLRRGWYRRLVPAGTRDEVGVGWHCIAEMTTPIRARPELEEQNRNRLANMELACRLIDGTRLDPGEIFSLRRIMGEPSTARGFTLGPVLIAGRLSKAIGGGLCQISTTLFNAALLANLQILEKWNHSTDIWGDERFIELGRDASFVYALRDLKLANQLADTIVVCMEVDESGPAVVCRVLSPTPLGYAVSVESTVLERLEPEQEAKPGMHAQCGWVVSTTRTISEPGGDRLTYRRVETYQPTFRTAQSRS